MYVVVSELGYRKHTFANTCDEHDHTKHLLLGLTSWWWCSKHGQCNSDQQCKKHVGRSSQDVLHASRSRQCVRRNDRRAAPHTAPASNCTTVGKQPSLAHAPALVCLFRTCLLRVLVVGRATHTQTPSCQWPCAPPLHERNEFDKLDRTRSARRWGAHGTNKRGWWVSQSF